VEGEGQLDLLDSPGIIPGGFGDQVAAQRLAICNDIGEAAYVDSIIAASFIMRCRLLPNGYRVLQKLEARYKVDARQGSAEDFVQVGARPRPPAHPPGPIRALLTGFFCCCRCLPLPLLLR
jgi:ribosome biogenesis GTPase A